MRLTVGISILLYLRASCPPSSYRNRPSKTAPVVQVYFAILILKVLPRKTVFEISNCAISKDRSSPPPPKHPPWVGRRPPEGARAWRLTTTNRSYCLGGDGAHSHYLWVGRGGEVAHGDRGGGRGEGGGGLAVTTQRNGKDFLSLSNLVYFSLSFGWSSLRPSPALFYLRRRRRRRQTSCGGTTTLTLRAVFPWISTRGECKRSRPKCAARTRRRPDRSRRSARPVRRRGAYAPLPSFDSSAFLSALAVAFVPFNRRHLLDARALRPNGRRVLFIITGHFLAFDFFSVCLVNLRSIISECEALQHERLLPDNSLFSFYPAVSALKYFLCYDLISQVCRIA